MNKTKVICTIGPASIDKEIMRKLIEKGMDAIRLNLSHGQTEFCDKAIKTLRELEKEMDVNIGIILDTKGPEVRVGKTTEPIIKLKCGTIVNIVKDDVINTDKLLSTDCHCLYDDIAIGHHVLLNEGVTILKVVDKYDGVIVCEVEVEGIYLNKDKVHFPDTNLSLPFLSKKDICDIQYAHANNVDFIALSMISSKEDVLEVNDMLINLKNNHMGIIAKIENAAATNNLDEIIKVSEAVMVARGDMGVELTMAKVPAIQKEIIEKCHYYGKISIVATEMMASMETHARPTGAEVADVANAVIASADAVMLSGETTIGNYPVETVDIMNKIIRSTEEDMNYIQLLDTAMRTEKQDITSAIAYSVVDSANRLKTKAIVAATASGYTARKISRFRPSCPIIATSPDIDVVKSLTLNFGVYPVQTPIINSTDEIVKTSKKVAIKMMELERTDKIIITGGFPSKEVKHTNFMKIEEI